MKKIIFFLSIVSCIVVLSGCEKGSDYYYAKYLNEAEIAKPGKVDSIQILPGDNRALLRFRVGPDRRVTKLKVAYNTSLSNSINTKFIDLSGADYGSFSEVEIADIPEATLFVEVVSYNQAGDSSTTAPVVSTIYGERYRSVLANRIFENISTVNGNKRINFLEESNKPRDATIFYPLQKTIVTYPLASGGTKTVELLLHSNFIVASDIAASGEITHYSIYKPVPESIDVFNSNTATVTF
ncbi:DUF4998 domain-containing protein [Niabella ginsengisoli]|uniref:DUF4998 domain-containing protein n=1 Tax=Niabella ginsengisoli TaxID=522298 RepID=A0ABS9SHP2_9BACT|nr:DUF4998 domain-containing protein [Niabella ginsengisoli]MCH5597872.1 DUF4998 domain-containing protein [Niabella ginsengisoli]